MMKIKINDKSRLFSGRHEDVFFVFSLRSIYVVDCNCDFKDTGSKYLGITRTYLDNDQEYDPYIHLAFRKNKTNPKVKASFEKSSICKLNVFFKEYSPDN